jgi:hypothetical protein
VAETRHKTVIEVHADIEPAKRKVADLQAAINRLASAAGGVVVGAAGGAAAGAAAGAGAGQASGGQPGARPGQGSDEGGGQGRAVKQTLMGQTAAQMIQSFGGGLPGMVAGSGMMLQGILRSAGEQMMKSTNALFGRLGQSFAGGLIGNVVGPMMALGGAGVSAAMGVANQRRMFNMSLNQATLSGVMGMAPKGKWSAWAGGDTGEEQARARFFLGTGKGHKGHLADTGWDPQAAAQTLLQWGQAKGTIFGGGSGFARAQTALRVARSGASLGVAAQYAGLAARGAGGADVGVERQIALAQQQGMRGSGIDRWLSMIASNTQSMAQQGFDLNLGAHDKLVRSILGTEGMKKSGYRAIQAAGMLGRQPMQAKQMLLGGLASVGPSAMIAAAAQGGGGIMGMAQSLEAMGRDPDAVRKQINELYGPEVAALFYAQQGMTTGMGRGLAGKLGKPIGEQKMMTWDPGELERVRVRAQASRMGAIDHAASKNLIESQENLTNALVHLGGIFESFLQLIKGQSEEAKKEAVKRGKKGYKGFPPMWP